MKPPVDSPSQNDHRPTRRKPLHREKKKAIIADLPAGISVCKLGNGYFRVRLGKKFTEAEPDVKDFQEVEGDHGARSFVESQIRDRAAIREMKLTPDQLAEAKRAFRRLGEDISLDTVVDYYFDSGPGGRAVKKIEDALALYGRHHVDAGNDPNYWAAQEISIKLLINTTANRALAYFTGERLAKWFASMRVERQWGDINTLNYVRDLNMFFRFCVRREFIGRNPFESPAFDWVSTLRKKLKKRLDTVEVYKVEEARKLLLAALEHPELDLLAWLVVALFLGVRVEELPRLTWDRFRWEEGCVSLTHEIVAKGGSPRHVPFTDAFLSWIKRVANLLERTGPICTTEGFRRRRDLLHEFAKVKKKRNGLRHTFASHDYVSHGSAQATRDKLGHEKLSDVLFKHYVALLTKAEASAFWALRPPEQPQEV